MTWVIAIIVATRRVVVVIAVILLRRWRSRIGCGKFPLKYAGGGGGSGGAGGSLEGKLVGALPTPP